MGGCGRGNDGWVVFGGQCICHGAHWAALQSMSVVEVWSRRIGGFEVAQGA